MSRVLVVDDEAHVREVLRRALSRWGYEVVEAENGSDALEKIDLARPEVILLDVAMPVMGGFEVLERLKELPSVAATPIILVTTLAPTEGEPIAMSLGCQHYISKPFDLDVLRSTIKVALRESQNSRKQEGESLPEITPRPPSQRGVGEDLTEPPLKTATPPHGVISTGIKLLDEELGGGIPRRSLTLIEGTPSAGKSLLCQHLAYQTLLNQEGVCYISSEETEQNLIARMSLVGMNVSEYFRHRQLQIHCLAEPVLSEHSDRSLTLLAQQISGVTRRYQTIIVDSITNHAVYIQEKPLIDFFRACKGQCQKGQTICLVTHSAIFEEKLWLRLRSLLDTHIRLSPKPIGRKLVKTLEILKINNTEVHTGNRIAFDVQSGAGMMPIRIAEFTA